jgi:hypothetical protein
MAAAAYYFHAHSARPFESKSGAMLAQSRD